MMETIKKFLIFFLLSLAVLAAAFAAPPRVAVGDFTVTSDNPKLKYVGKGLAEMVAAELAASKGVILIDRDKREAALGEMEFSLSGMADAESQIEAGKLLSADYLLFGEIIDMDQAVLVSCKMIKVETGQVAWTDKNLGPLSDYDKISRKFAVSALKGLGAEKAAVAVAAPKVESKASAEKKVEAIVAFSGAVAALDKKDNAEAKRQIAKAKAIDPTNAAVTAYAAKLAGGSPRFLVELDSFSATYNPALLGFEDKLRVYTWQSVAEPVGSDVDQYGGYAVMPTSNPDDSIYYKEGLFTNRTGVLVPIGKRMGIMAEFNIPNRNSYVGSDSPASDWNLTNPEFEVGKATQVNLDQQFYGANLGIGYRILESLSVGVAGGAAYLAKGTEQPETAVFSDIYPETVGLYYSATAGLAYRSAGGALSADAELAWTNQPSFLLDGPDDGDYSASNAYLDNSTQPLLVSAGATAALFNHRLFVNARGIGEFGTDERGFLAFRAIPGLELWPLSGVALRASYEYAYVSVEEGGYTGGEASASGSGFMGGITFSFRGFELSANYINRFRPLHELPGAGHQNMALLFGLSYSGLVERK
jgi:TolB-like protein